MALPVKPALVSAYGTESWGFAPTIADLNAPTVAELTAAAGINLSCMLFGEQEGVSVNTEKVTLPRRLCETVQFESNGPTTYSMSDLQASFDPQAAAGADGKLAWEALESGTTGYLWRRQGVDATADITAGEFVDIVPVEFGPKTPTKTGTGADGVYSFTVPVAITDTPAFNVAVVAGV